MIDVSVNYLYKRNASRKKKYQNSICNTAHNMYDERMHCNASE